MQLAKPCRWLTIIGVIASGLTLCVLVLQQILGEDETQHAEPIIWFTISFLPIALVLAAARYVSDKNNDAEVPTPSAAIAEVTFSFYLILASLTVFLEPFAESTAMELRQQSYIWLIPTQVVAALLIILAFRRRTSKNGSTYDEGELVKRIAELEAKFAAQSGLTAEAAGDGTTNLKLFDIFLVHSSNDKPFVQQIANQLRERGLKPWLDVEQIPPGTFFQDVIQAAIPVAKTAAVFVGPTGLGKVQHLELRVLITQCVERDTRVIPVLLPGAAIPQELLFLKELHWVKFRCEGDTEALDLLQFGITGTRATTE